ncbi:MAG: LacI family transcriptional regulator [Paenibacillus sp.]|jgi:DNA-binding LacI/PurR family transcriptional regulator|nr:LacI family transcriptional regulator [Paenibacillus sp.]
MIHTIKDVAREANVSIATVSRVINGKDKVRKETREKIQRAIAKLNYTPDQAARSMIVKKTRIIGMIVPLLTNEYWAALAELIQSELLKRGYTLIIGTSNDEHNSSLTAFLERRVDGLLIGGMLNFQDGERVLSMFREQGIPMVSFDSRSNQITSVNGDNMSSAMEATEHLIGLGHTRIAYIGSVSTSLERELGYRNALMLNQIGVDEELVISGRTTTVHNFSLYGYQCTKQLLDDKRPFTAVFCSNDLIAIGAIKAFEEYGMEVPRDKAVVGFDDISLASLYRPSLTTIQQPVEAMVEAAVELILEQIENLDKSFTPKKVTFPMKLIIRQSSGAPIG